MATKTKKEEVFKILKTENISLNFYAVRSKDGKWLRTTGQGGGRHWVDELSEAKIYGRPGPAKAQVTFWGTNYPEFGVPDLVQITSGTCNYLDQSDRVEDASRKKKLREAQQKVRNIEFKINNYIVDAKMIKNIPIDSWKKELEQAKNKVELLK